MIGKIIERYSRKLGSYDELKRIRRLLENFNRERKRNEGAALRPEDLIRETTRHEFEEQYYYPNERSIEVRFLFDALARFYPREVLDVGTGVTATPSVISNCGFICTAIDNISDYWNRDVQNRHFHVLDQSILSPQLEKQFNLINCMSVLEHIPEHRRALTSMFGLLAPGGYLVLTFPYNERQYVPNAYMLPGAGYGQDAKYICQIYSRQEVDQWLEDNAWEIVEQEYWRVFTGEFWTFGSRLIPAERTTADAPHHLSCILLRRP